MTAPPDDLRSRWPGLDGGVAVVTGASRGIGKEIASQLARAGASVCITGRRADRLDAAVEELRRFGTVIGIAGDTADADHRHETIVRVVDELGPVTVLVNNAATNRQFGPLVAASEASVLETIEANLLAPLAWAQAVAGGDAERGGAIVNVSSVGGQYVGWGTGAYNISKAGLEQLTRQLALELAPRWRVNAVAPGLVPTNFSSVLVEGREELLASAHPLGRLGEPTDIAAMVLFMASELAAWITGQVVTVDGGGSSLGDVGRIASEGRE